MFVAKIDRHGVLCLAFFATLLAAVQDVKAQEPTAKVYITPVASHPGGPFITGGFYADSDISGQTLTVQAGGGRIYIDAQVSDWGPARLRSFWVTVDAASLRGENANPPNPGCDLMPAVEACVSPVDCQMAFGTGSVIECNSLKCDPDFMDFTREDFLFNDDSIFGTYSVGSMTNPGGTFFSGSLTEGLEALADVLEPGNRSNLGTLALDVPACAAGIYTISLLPDFDTILVDNAVPPGTIPIAELVAATITISNCDTDSDCDDSDLCTDDICNAMKFCTYPPKSSWDPQTQCCNPPTGATALFSLTRLCVDVSCSLGGSLGTLVSEQHPEGTTCNLNDPCTVDEICTASGSCLGTEFTGPACQKSRFITLTPAAMGGESAIRVTLASLHRPDPPFPIPPVDGDFSAFEGEVRWVGPVDDCSNGPALGTTFKCATLQCTPFYTDWAVDLGNEFLHVTGAAVVPSSRYDIDQVPVACSGVEDSCGSIVPEPIATTSRWADLTPPYHSLVPGSPQQPNGFDVVAMIDIVGIRPGTEISRMRGLLAGDTIDPHTTPNVFEITLLVDGIKGKGFPYAGPAPCSP